MSIRPDPDLAITAWLTDEARDGAQERLLSAIREQVESTHQRRPLWPARRIPTMNTFTRFAAAAAAVAVVAVVGMRLLPSQGVGPGSSATPSPTRSAPSATPAPSGAAGPSALPGSGALTPGTYIIGDPFRLEVSMDLGEGWNVWGGLSGAGASIYKDSPDPPNGRAIVVTIVNLVYTDPCDDNKGTTDPGPTPNDLAVALAKQPRTQASAISDVTLAGYSGKYVEYTFGGPEVGGCFQIDRWPMAVGPRQAVLNESDKVWILDVEGARLVIDVASFPGVSAAGHAEMLAIVNSIKITP